MGGMSAWSMFTPAEKAALEVDDFLSGRIDAADLSEAAAAVPLAINDEDA